MSIGTIAISASGLETYTDSLGVIANNLANLNTNAFKGSSASFREQLYWTLNQPGNQQQGRLGPLGRQYGLGVSVGNIQTNFDTGPAVTGLNFDALINDAPNVNGPAFFRVIDSQGQVFYTRLGSFQPKGAGASGPINLQLPDGPFRLANIVDGKVVPLSLPGGSAFPGLPSFNPDGSIDEGGSTGLRVQLVRFRNPDGLIQKGELLFRQGPNTGGEIVGFPGDPGFGPLVEGSLEGSNVELSTELVNLLNTSNAFNFNAQSFQAGNTELVNLLTVARQAG